MKSIFNNKNLKYGSLFIVLGLVVIGITVVINLLAEMDKFNVEWDLTANKMYSIGEQTDKILNSLDKEVEIIFLADKEAVDKSSAGAMVNKFLGKYDAYPKLTVKYIDPDTNPGIMKELDKGDLLGLQEYGVVVKSGNKVKQVVAEEMFFTDPNSQAQFYAVEQKITGAIKYVTTEKTPVVYFAEGHSERALEEEYLGLKMILENGNYIVKKINLAVIDTVPEDAEMVVFAGPKIDLSKAEADRLVEYFKNDGNCIFLFDPVNSDKKFENFEYVLNEYNISLNYDKVKEFEDKRYYTGAQNVFLPAVQSSDITGEVNQELFIVLKDSRSITLLNNQKEPLTVSPLLETSDKAIGESYGIADGEDTFGPLYVGACAEYNSAYKSKIVVLGSAYSVTDEAFESLVPYSENTMGLFLASISWMSDKTDDLVIAQKTDVYDVMNLTSKSARSVIIVTVIVVPLLIIGIGVIVWLRRKRL